MKRTRGKKNTSKNMKRDEPSASTSSASTSTGISRRGSRTTDNKIQGEKASEKISKAGSLNPSGQVQIEAGAAKSQGSKEEESFINNLPPEMLTRILKFVDTPNLLNCRLVNRNWSAISSGILFNIPRNNFITFLCCDIICFHQDTRLSPLNWFLECMRRSKNCPYSHFTFVIRGSCSEAEILNQDDFNEFLSDFAPSNSSQNPRIKGLQFVISSMDYMKKFQLFIEKLVDLLQNKTPRLEHLILDFQNSVKAPQVSLFSAPKETEANAAAVQFPHLKSIYFGKDMISTYTQIVKDLLNAAVNLTWLRLRATKFQHFQLLHSLGKLHHLKEVELEIDQEFFSVIKSDKNDSSFPLPKLEFLHLIMTSMTRQEESFKAQATTFLANLFESSKDSMDLLAVEPILFLSSLQLPTFENLRKLHIRQCYNKIDYSLKQIFPPGIRSRNVFPAVCYLDLEVIHDWAVAFPTQDSIPILPNLFNLRLKDREIDEDVISILALMCPNLRNFKIYRNDEDDPDDSDDDELLDISPQLDLLQVGRAIWTHMKQLESLEVDLHMCCGSENSCTALESCFTGISEENCQSLSKLTESIKKSERGKHHGKIHESQYEQLAVREYPSILDMKDLKTLTINPYCGKGLLDKKEFFTDKLTYVSQEYAFKLMPELKLNED